LQQLYGDAHQFSIDFSAGDVCKVTIRIPLHTYVAPAELVGARVQESKAQ